MKKYYLFLIDFTNPKPKEIKTPMIESEISNFITKQSEDTLKKNFIYGFYLEGKGIKEVKCFHYATSSYQFINDQIDIMVSQNLKKFQKLMR